MNDKKEVPCKGCISLAICKGKVIDSSKDKQLDYLASKIVLNCPLLNAYDNVYIPPHIDIELKKIFGEEYKLSMNTKIFKRRWKKHHLKTR